MKLSENSLKNKQEHYVVLDYNPYTLSEIEEKLSVDCSYLSVIKFNSLTKDDDYTNSISKNNSNLSSKKCNFSKKNSSKNQRYYK